MKVRVLVLSTLLATISFGQAPAVADGGVLNAASFARGQAVAPGSLVSIFGSNLAAATALADSIPLSTALGNVKVTFNGIEAPLLAVIHGASGDQINAQVPWDAAAGDAAVVVTSGGTASAPASAAIGPLSPGIFTLQGGVGQAIAINLDGSLAAPPGSVPGIATHPAPAGSVIVILGTGLGAVDSPVGNGQASTDKLRNTVAAPAVLVGGVAAQVSFSGLTPQFPGVNQVNAQIAAATPTGNTVPLQFQVGGITTSDQVPIAVGNP